jgi:hypothetical protein
VQHAAQQALSEGGHIQPPAYPQQQQFSPVGRGGPYSTRPPPTGQFSPSREVARSAARAPLPTAWGQFPTSYVRSRVHGCRGGDANGEEGEEDHHRA